VELQGDSAGTIEMMEGFDLVQVEGTNNLADLGAYQLAFKHPVTLVTNHTDNLPNCDPSAMSKLPPNVFLGSINVRADGSRWVVQSNPQFYNQKLDVAADARIVTNAPLTLTVDSALGMGDADNITLSPSEAGLRVGTRSGSLEKLGASDLSILGRLYVANYSKITVAEGRLVLSNRTAEGYGQMDVEVRAGAILAGGSADGSAGLIPGTVTVHPNGTIDPGSSPYGVLSVIGDHPDVNLLAESTFHTDLGGVTPGALHDQLRLQGELRLGDDAGRPILDPQLAYAAGLGDLFFIIRDDSTLPVAGLFKTEFGAVLNQGDIFSVVSDFDGGTYQFQISYRGDVGGAQFDLPAGNDVALKVVAVPELSSCLLLLAGGMAALGLRRFRCR
jgi:hypothetical protein